MSYGDVPNNWQDLHKCSGKLDEKGRCIFCQFNAPDGKGGSSGYEIIPFDIPGVYDPKGEPNILIRHRPKN
jgi:hypothetical protein